VPNAVHIPLAERLGDALAQHWGQGEIAWVLGIVYLGGLLTSLSPCVYPLIPLTLRFFASVKSANRWATFRLAVAYVLGMAVLYSAAGTIFAAMGKALGAYLTSPLMLSVIALLFVALALSMFGLFELRLPGSLAANLTKVRGANLLRAFAMGLVSGIIAAPCTGPVAAFLLTLVATTRAIAAGGVLLFVFALGVGTPFLVLGMFTHMLAKLPRSGAWMERVRELLGMLMVGMALYFSQFISPRVNDLVSDTAYVNVTVLFILLTCGFTLWLYGTWQRANRRTDDQPAQPGKETPLALLRLAKTAGIAVISVGFFVFFNLAVGATDAPGSTKLTWASENQADAALSAAHTHGQPALMDFYADWCPACVELSVKTFPDPAVEKALANWVLIKVDGTVDSDAVTRLVERYHIPGFPTVLFFDSSGKLLDTPRLSGYVPPERFLEIIKSIH
jgi:thioredoxin:protein disulfide reductase